MSDVVLAEVERVVRVSVRVDVAAFCACYADERKRDGFEGNDAAYVRDFIKSEAYDLLRDGDSGGEEGDGVEVSEEWDETDVTFLGVVRA